MIIYARTNDKLYPMTLISRYEKSDDNKIKFTFSNGQSSIEEYENTDKRDTAFNNIDSEFTKNVDS